MEASLSSTIVFKINGVAVSQFQNAYEVKTGDRIEITMGTRTVTVEVLQVADNVHKDDAAAMYKEV
jgi:ribosomal 50S subunit-recycling heat shock protein